MKEEKKIRRILSFVLSAAAVMLLGVVLAAVIRYFPAYETAEISQSVLYADRTMLGVGEKSRVEFCIRTTVSADEKFCLYEGGEQAADFIYAGREGDTYIYKAELEIEEWEPVIRKFTGKSESIASTELAVRVTPEVTEEMTGVLFAVLEDIDGLLEQIYPEGEEGKETEEESLTLVEEFLSGDSRVKMVEKQEDFVYFLTTDGLSGMYKLPPEEGTFGGSAAKAELVDAVRENRDFSDIYVYNEYSPTNTKVLFQQRDKKMTKDSYHEDFCASFGGEVTVKRDRDFLSSIVSGDWNRYGTIVVNTHGERAPKEKEQKRRQRMSHADGSYRAFMSAYEGSYKDTLEAVRTENIVRCLFNDYQNYKEMGDEDFKYGMAYVYTTGHFLGKKCGIGVSTDYLMDVYQNTQFDNAVFYFDICYMMLDKTFCRFLLDHGAQAVIGVDFSVSEDISQEFFGNMAERLRDEGRAGKLLYVDVEKANIADESAKYEKKFLVFDVVQILFPGESCGYQILLRPSESKSMGSDVSQFTHKDTDKMKGSVVSADGTAVEGALVQMARYDAHELLFFNPAAADTAGYVDYAESGEAFYEADRRIQETGYVFQTGKNGVFETEKILWGTYIISVKNGDEAALAQVDFHGQDVGEIVVRSNTEGREDLLERYYRKRLVPRFGELSGERISLKTAWTEDYCGIVSHDIFDYDGDGQAEMLVMRSEAEQGSRDIAVYSVLQMYGVEYGGVVLKDSVRMDEKNIMDLGRYPNLQIGVFRQISGKTGDTMLVWGIDARDYYRVNLLQFREGKFHFESDKWYGFGTMDGALAPLSGLEEYGLTSVWTETGKNDNLVTTVILEDEEDESGEICTHFKLRMHEQFKEKDRDVDGHMPIGELEINFENISREDKKNKSITAWNKRVLSGEGEASELKEEPEIGEVEPPEPSLKDRFMEYVSETLILQHGVMGTEDLVSGEYTGGKNLEDTAFLTGLLNADVRDYDGDGREEMFVTLWNAASAGYMGVGLTSLKLLMYECKDTGEIVQTAEKVLYPGGGGGYLAEPLIQTSCFTYDYKGKTYLAVDNYLSFNDKQVTLDIYQYDGASFVFVQGIGYQEQGQGDRFVKTLDKEQTCEPTSRIDSMTGCGYDAAGWEEVMSYTVDRSSPDVVLSEAEEKEFYDCYSDLVKEHGLKVKDSRLRIVQGNADKSLSGEEYKKWYNQFAETAAPEVYTPAEGDIHFLCGVLEGRRMDEVLCLYRRDYEGSLDAWRR